VIYLLRFFFFFLLLPFLRLACAIASCCWSVALLLPFLLLLLLSHATPYSCYPLLTLQSLSLSLVLFTDDHKLPWVFSSVGWKAWPDSCRLWISVLVYRGRQQIDIITAAKPSERWRRGRQVHTTTVGADRSTHGRQNRRRSYERRRRDRRKEKPTKNTYCNKLRANNDTQKRGNAQEDGFPVEQSSLSGRDREISRSTTRITDAIATTNNQRFDSSSSSSLPWKTDVGTHSQASSRMHSDLLSCFRKASEQSRGCLEPCCWKISLLLLLPQSSTGAL